MLFSRVKISCFRAKTHLEFQWCLDKYFVLSSSQSLKSCGFRSVTERLGYLITSRTDPFFSEGSLCLLKSVTTVNSLYCGHCRDLESVSSLARLRNSGSLFQSNVCNLFNGDLAAVRFIGVSVISGCPQSESRLYIMAHLPLQAFLLSAFTNSRSLSKLLAVKTCLFPSVAMNFNSLRLYAPTPTAIIVRSKMKHVRLWPRTVFFVLRRGL